MADLVLIPLDHGYRIHGSEALLEIYAQIKPTMIMSEASKPDFNRYKTLHTKLESGLLLLTSDKQKVKDYVDTIYKKQFYELASNEAYTREHNIPHILTSVPNRLSPQLDEFEERIDNKLKEWEGGLDLDVELYKAKTWNGMSKEALQKNWDSAVQYENKLVSEIAIWLRRIIRGQVGGPDKYMESVVRDHIGQDGVIAFPVGLAHCVDSFTKQTLYSRVKDLEPKRILLV